MSMDDDAIGIVAHEEERQSFCSVATLTSVLFTPLIYTSVIFVWVGLWDIADFYWSGSDRASDVCYMFLGLTVMVVTHSFLPQAGMKKMAYQRARTRNSDMDSAPYSILEYLADFFSDHREQSATKTSRLVLYVRALLSLTAGIAFWLGSYNLIDIHLISINEELSILLHFGYMFVGVLLLWMSGTLMTETDVETEDVVPETMEMLDNPLNDPDADDDAESNVELILVVHTTGKLFLHYGRGLCAIYGSVIYWVGAYNFVDVDIAQSTVARDIIYIAAAFVYFCVTGAHVEWEAQQIENNAKTPHRPTPPATASEAIMKTVVARTFFIVRVIVSLLASILFWVGWWNLMTYHIIIPPPNRDDEMEAPPIPEWSLYLIYITLGLCALIFTGQLIESSGVLAPMTLLKRRLGGEIQLIDFDKKKKQQAAAAAAQAQRNGGGRLAAQHQQQSHNDDEDHFDLNPHDRIVS